MPRRRLALAVTLFLATAAVWAESPGQRELSLGREALARRDYPAAAKHLSAAIEALDPQGEKDALADAWLELGVAGLTGLGRAEDALAAFMKSAELSANPASAWLWASKAAEKLGRADEAADYEARALAPPPPPPVPRVAIPAAEPAPVAEPSVPVQPAPEPAAEPAKPDAFQHLFGAKERPPAAPAAPDAAPAPEASPAPPPQEPQVFERLFGESRPDRPEGAREAQSQAPERKEVAEKAAEKKTVKAKKGDAFRHLFGEKRENDPQKKEEDSPPPQ
jgi:tetratricopeptide (TPR) repeat protein